jgi:hypothetical protein
MDDMKTQLAFALFLALGALTCIQASDSAENDSVNAGPYRISFDLGLPQDAYKVDIGEPKESETLGGNRFTEYRVQIINETGPRLILLNLNRFEKDQAIPTGSEIEQMLRSIESSRAYDIDAASRIIDGSAGAVRSAKIDSYGSTTETYLASYFPKFDPKLIVVIFSSYPWDEGTLNLLKTIHIEKTK